MTVQLLPANFDQLVDAADQWKQRSNTDLEGAVCSAASTCTQR